MEKDEKMESLITQFNLNFDYSILTFLDREDLSTDVKKYFIEHYQDRIDKMDMDIFLQTIRQTNQEFCEKCSEYLFSKIQTLTVAQVENLLYINKHYHEISPLADFLLKQNWFQEKKEYKTFLLAYELEKMLKTESIDKEKITNIGTNIISKLVLIDGYPMLFDMVIKNYLSLLKKYNPEYYENFRKLGYDIINQQISNNQELTKNMIIFDCRITETKLPAGIVDYFEFYEDEEDETYAYEHAGIIRINMSAIKKMYEEYGNKKFGTQMLFLIVGHEIDHVFCERYKTLEKNFADDFITQLKVFNSSIAEALQQVISRSYYLEYHDCFAQEYSANIQGINSLYQKQKYLPSIGIEDKEEINKFIAQELLYSYCLVAGDSNQCRYVSPIEFTRRKFENYKDNLPGYASYCLLNKQKELPSELEIVEKELTEEEKLMLGYYNKYLGILDLIAKGEVKSTNLFDDLPILYEKYKDVIEGDFLPYLTGNSGIRKK